MATRKNQKKKKAGRKRASSKGPAPRRRRDGKAAAEGMLTGASILAFIALMAFVRIGGETPLNHLINLFGSESSATKTGEQAQPKAVKKSTRTIKLNPTNQARPGSRIQSSTNAADAPPLEKLTDEDQEGLDRLIKAKGK